MFCFINRRENGKKTDSGAGGSTAAAAASPPSSLALSLPLPLEIHFPTSFACIYLFFVFLSSSPRVLERKREDLLLLLTLLLFLSLSLVCDHTIPFPASLSGADAAAGDFPNSILSSPPPSSRLGFSLALSSSPTPDDWKRRAPNDLHVRMWLTSRPQGLLGGCWEDGLSRRRS